MASAGRHNVGGMTNTVLTDRSSRRQFIKRAALVSLGSTAVFEALSMWSTKASAATLATRVSVVGDSLTVGTLPYQARDFVTAGWMGSAIDAYVSRGIRTKVPRDPHTGLTAVDALRAAHGDTTVWVVALGTNDSLIYRSSRYPAVIEQMLDHIGNGHRVVWVNAYLPKAAPHQNAWNEALGAVAAERPEQLTVCDWAALAAQNPSWLAADRIHCNTTGYQRRSAMIAEASRLAMGTRFATRLGSPAVALRAFGTPR
jgi:lysophospholipase L1-like esterase